MNIAIENMNNEILLEVFSYLDGVDLKKCSLTCKSWADLIGSSISTMKKLSLSITGHINARKIQQMKTLKRNYRAVNFKDCVIANNTIEALMSNLTYVQDIKILGVTITGVSFKRLIQSCSMLEKLTIYGSKISRHEFDGQLLQGESLQNLKSLSISSSDLNFFGFFNNTGLKTFSLLYDIMDSQTGNAYEQRLGTELEKLLKLQDNLENLSITCNKISIYKRFMKTDENDYKFKLKRFSIMYLNDNDLVNDDTILDLLIHHKDSLEHLEVHNAIFHERAYQTVLPNMNLKSLKFDWKALPNKFSYYPTIVNNSLKRLILEVRDENKHAVWGLMNSYRSIEYLSLKTWNAGIVNDILVYVEYYLKNLKYLKLHEIPAYPPKLSIPSLKCLHIDYIYNTFFHGFVIKQHNLEEFSFGWINSEKADELDAVMKTTKQLPKLKKLSLGHNNNFSSDMMKTIKRDCKNLKCVNVFSEDDDNQNLSENVNGLQIKYFTVKSQPFIYHVKYPMLDVDE